MKFIFGFLLGLMMGLLTFAAGVAGVIVGLFVATEGSDAPTAMPIPTEEKS